MLILALETSCDETAAAVVADGARVLASVIESQAALHAATGGVVPEVAAREHVAAVLPAVSAALQTAGVTLAAVDAIAVTHGPGLASSLLSGVATANTLATLADKPLVGVNHIFGHIRANWLERSAAEIQFPVVTLTASGGHNELVLLADAHAPPQLLGETLDDAAGEAFDKVARLLGLPYPGGPAIEKLAASISANPPFSKGAGGFIEPLPRAWLLPRDVARNFDGREMGQRLRAGRTALTNFDFSFSGLKSEVRRRVEISQPVLKNGDFTAALAAEFQTAVVDVLATKLVLAGQKYGARELHLAGGVSANGALRSAVQNLAAELLPHAAVRWPQAMSFCTDNAAMIAAAAEWQIQNAPAKYRVRQLLDVQPNLNF